MTRGHFKCQPLFLKHPPHCHMENNFKKLVFSFSSAKCPGEDIVGSHGNCVFRFLRTSILFSKMAASIHIPMNSLLGFHFFPVFLPGEFHRQMTPAGYSPWSRKKSDTTEQLTHFFHILAKIVVCGLFNDSHYDHWEVISYCDFDLHFPNDYRYWVYFHGLVGHLCVFFGKMSIQVFCSFKKQFKKNLFDIELYKLFIYFGYEPLIRHIIWKYLCYHYMWNFKKDKQVNIKNINRLTENKLAVTGRERRGWNDKIEIGN